MLNIDGKDNLETQQKAGQKKPKNSLIRGLEIFVKFFRLILTVFLVASLIGAGWFIFTAYRGNIGELSALIAERQQKYQNKNQELTGLKGLKVDYANLADSEKKILEALPAKKDLPGLFVQLESLANKNNISLISVDFAAEEQKSSERLHKLSINIVTDSGDYFALKNFLADTEKNLRLTDVKAINFDSAGKTLNLTLNVYYYEE
ncbi:type 4a pilus biogenesis protein PilO [Candidatus Falkowbacteria bacterium]|nr:type 4a pilus biogenesis protein PilO [Candidatus Falkowbacteria bacterium]